MSKYNLRLILIHIVIHLILNTETDTLRLSFYVVVLIAAVAFMTVVVDL